LTVWAGGLVLLAGGTMVRGGEPVKPVTGKDRDRIIRALEKDRDFIKARDKGKATAIAPTRLVRFVHSTMLRFKATPLGAAAEQELVQSLHFRYLDGKTIRTTCTAANARVLKIEELEAYPTPLTDQEIADAQKLAREKDSRVKEMFKKYKASDLDIQAVAPVVAFRKNPLFGKRLATLFLTPKKNAGAVLSVTVNLTDGEVVAD
jgi:hypothetical protein